MWAVCENEAVWLSPGVGFGFSDSCSVISEGLISLLDANVIYYRDHETTVLRGAQLRSTWEPGVKTAWLSGGRYHQGFLMRFGILIWPYKKTLQPKLPLSQKSILADMD